MAGRRGKGAAGGRLPGINERLSQETFTYFWVGLSNIFCAEVGKCT